MQFGNLRAACLCGLIWPHFAAALTPAQSDAIDRAVVETLAATAVPGASIAVVQNGAVVYAKAYGVAVLPATNAKPEMAFPLGSVSKQFTASLVLLLAQDGKLSLDDKVSRFLPNLAHAREVTIRQLLSHTSGYEDFAPEDFTTPAMTRPVAPQTVAAQWGGRKLDFSPGTRWQYSNTGFTIAALVAQAAGGAPFFDQLKARVLAPLHLDSAVDYDAHGLPPNSPAGYQRHALGAPRLAAPDQPGWSFGSGELAMTARDLAAWDISLMDRSLLAPTSTIAMETPVRLKNGADTGYGLGVEIRKAGQHLGLHHSGEETGFTAYNEVFPDDRAAVAVMTNMDATPASGVIARQIEQIAFGIPAAAPADKAQAQLLCMLADLAAGHIDASRLNDNARFYFSPRTLADYRNSLAPLGPVISLHERSHQARGGMMFHAYDVAYLTRRLVVTTYELPDGRLGQLLVEP